LGQGLDDLSLASASDISQRRLPVAGDADMSSSASSSSLPSRTYRHFPPKWCLGSSSGNCSPDSENDQFHLVCGFADFELVLLPLGFAGQLVQNWIQLCQLIVVVTVSG